MKTSLNAIKEEMTTKVLNKLYDMRYMTAPEKELYQNDIANKLKQKMLVTTLRTQSGITNAYDYNQTAYELYLDLLTTFDYVDTLYQTINTHQALNESVIHAFDSRIGEMNDALDEYEATLGSVDAPLCYIENFRTQAKQSWDRKYYTERYGERMPLETFVRFNGKQENITLNYTRQQNVMVYNSGVQLGEISITKQYGAGFIKAKNEEEKLENAIDTSPTSYWAETILANEELMINGEGFETNGVKQSTRSFYNLPRGAMCEICLTFESMAKINEISLNPFGNFPIDIIAIRYSLTDDDEDDTYDIVAPENIENDWLISKTIRKEYAFHFPEIQCKKLYILINQLHCIKTTYMLSCNQMFKNELWFNATYSDTDDVVMSNQTVFAPLYIDRAQESNVWKYINNKMLTSKEIDVNDLLINNKDKYLPVTKYQYTYGFYNIAPYCSEFQQAGVFVSEQIQCSGPIASVTLTSDEQHFKTPTGQILTDIEFYITTKQDPLYTDWIPICPKNKDYIYHERLQLDYDVCYLRHKAICRNVSSKDENGNLKTEHIRPVVYINDTILIEDADYILHFDENHNVVSIEIADIDFFSVYTVSYQPIEDSKIVHLVDDTNAKPTNTFQEIEGTGVGCYELNGYPYYLSSDVAAVSTYVKLINTQTGEAMYQTSTEDSVIQCVTNKDNPADSYKNFVANTNKIQYYTNGKYLYFNQAIMRGMKIEISYPAIESAIRVKAILRRNSKANLWLTPVLNQYKLEFTTIGG